METFQKPITFMCFWLTAMETIILKERQLL